jgi:hypothetical protein
MYCKLKSRNRILVPGIAGRYLVMQGDQTSLGE